MRTKGISKRKLENKKGITLIALVITIIVLLILAGVSIATLTGQNGLLTKAQTAGEETEIEGLEEEIKLAVQSSKISDYSEDKTTLKEELEKIQGATVTMVGDNKENAEESEILAYDIEKEGNSYTVYEDGEMLEGGIDIWDGVSYEKPVIDKNGRDWHIYTCAQFKYLSMFTNNDATLTTEDKEGVPELGENTIVYLENNLDMGARHDEDGNKTRGTSWTPIRLSLSEFNGNNYIIQGIYAKNVENKDIRWGLFSSGNRIKNTTIKDSYIYSEEGVKVGKVYGTGAISGSCMRWHFFNRVYTKLS